MPTLSRYFVKTGLACLVIGMFLGVFIAAQPTLKLPTELNTLRPVALHLLTVGWVTQLIFGVAFWMFPKYTRAQPRRSLSAGWAVYLLLNVGLGLRVVGEPAAVLAPSGWTTGVIVISAALQWAAAWLFVLNIWGRVKER